MKQHRSNNHPFVIDTAVDPPDPRVTAELRAVTTEIPYHMVDWDAVRASIVGDAAALFGRSMRRPWTAYVARWSSTALPVGLAASIVAGMFVFYTSRSASQIVASEEVALSPVGVLSTVTGISTGTELAATVTQSFRVNEDTLVQGVVP